MVYLIDFNFGLVLSTNRAVQYYRSYPVSQYQVGIDGQNFGIVRIDYELIDDFASHFPRNTHYLLYQNGSNLYFIKFQGSHCEDKSNLLLGLDDSRIC